jgi:hypothetical protein
MFFYQNNKTGIIYFLAYQAGAETISNKRIWRIDSNTFLKFVLKE